MTTGTRRRPSVGSPGVEQATTTKTIARKCATSALATERYLARLDPAMLHELGRQAEAARHRRRWAHVIDPKRTAGEWAEALAGGATLTVGWWRARVERRPLGDPALRLVRAPSPEAIARAVAALVVEVPGMAANALAGAVVALAVDAGADRAALRAAASAGVRAALRHVREVAA